MISPHRTNPQDLEKLTALSLRERQVLALVARGKSAKGIGLILKISPRTVNFHVGSVIRKLGADNRLQAVAIAVRGGLLAPDR
jgi:DNA-binding CsgD family transcriptional regulator